MDRSELLALLPRLKPMAEGWAEEHQARILAAGQALDENLVAIAQLVGVSDPTRVRILTVGSIPKPENPELLVACEAADFLGPNTVGLTLFRGIYIAQRGASDLGLKAHELRHVAQYEKAGSIPAFLEVYLTQLLTSDPGMAPLEVDAHLASAGAMEALRRKSS